MIDTNTLSATKAVADVERFLAQQYARQHVAPVQRKTPIDGVIVILAWIVVGWIVMGGK